MTEAGNQPIIILGGGGHAAVVAEILLSNRITPYGYTALEKSRQDLPGHPGWLGTDHILSSLGDNIALANGLGVSGRNMDPRTGIFQALNSSRFPVLQHASAIVGSSCRIGNASQIHAGAVLQPRCNIGQNVVINTRASIDHDCQIADHVFIAPGATICGGCIIGQGSLVGAGAVLLPGITIGAGAVIGAGAICVIDVPDGGFVSAGETRR